MIDDIDPNNPQPPDAGPTPLEPQGVTPQAPIAPQPPEANVPQAPIAPAPAETGVPQPPAPAPAPAPLALEPAATPAAIVPALGEEIKPLPKRKTLSIIIHDAGVLRAAYMQFIKGGGLFIPTKKAFAMGEDTNLIIRLLDDDEPYRVSGKVVWITPAGAPGGRAGGIGVEFADDINGEHLRSRIEVILGPHLKSTESTHTM